MPDQRLDMNSTVRNVSFMRLHIAVCMVPVHQHGAAFCQSQRLIRRFPRHIILEPAKDGSDYSSAYLTGTAVAVTRWLTFGTHMGQCQAQMEQLVSWSSATNQAKMCCHIAGIELTQIVAQG